jgi:multidrug resistance efflux pump
MAVACGCESAQEKAKAPTAEKAKKEDAKTPAGQPATAKVEKGPLKIEVELKGVFEAEDMTEVVLRPEAFIPDVRGILTVLTAVEQGTAVHKGETLVTLDLEKIDQMIQDLKVDQRLAELALKEAEEELPVLEKNTPLELAAAERAKKVADEDLKYYLETGRPHAEKSALFDVKSAGHWLEYAKEELRQLEKMYRAKDLTEETEEIILKRQRNAVESAAFSLQSAEIRRDETLKVELPRKEVTMKEAAVKNALSLEKARNILPLTLSQKRLALEKIKYERTKAEDKLRKFEKDRETMTVKSPADGVVYYGKCLHGKWTTAGSVAEKLQRGGVLMPDEVFMTIVKPRPMFVRATIEEKDLHQIRPGLKGKIVPVPYPERKLSAGVKSVSAIPVTPGTFEARIPLETAKDPDALVPGMACTIKFVPYSKEEALTVPADAVFTEDLDDDKHYVFLAVKGGKPEKRPVTIGKKTDKKTEILQGLREGDEILLEKPKGPEKK